MHKKYAHFWVLVCCKIQKVCAVYKVIFILGLPVDWDLFRVVIIKKSNIPEPKVTPGLKKLTHSSYTGLFNNTN